MVHDGGSQGPVASGFSRTSAPPPRNALLRRLAREYFRRSPAITAVAKFSPAMARTSSSKSQRMIVRNSTSLPLDAAEDNFPESSDCGQARQQFRLQHRFVRSACTGSAYPRQTLESSSLLSTMII